MKTVTLRSVAGVTAFITAIGVAIAQGYGPGMMGGGGYGPGMMGGGGYGPGMMGGRGYGPGMMGGGYGGLNLSAEQHSKMVAIQEKLDQQHWDLMGKMHQQGYRSMDFYQDGKFNEEAARKHYETMAVFHKQIFESSIKAQKEIDALLTQEQRLQLQRGWQGR